jgi:hypothetical protein
MRMRELALLGVRVAAGTAVYVIIVVLAGALPAAAGLMLTFPALNGLAFLYSEDERAAAIARSMLWMPAINGVLCAGYISVFALVATVRSATLVAWGLVGLDVALWLACVSRERVRKGVAREHQLAFVVAMTVIGVVLAAGGAFEAAYLAGADLHSQIAPGSDGANWIAARAAANATCCPGSENSRGPLWVEPFDSFLKLPNPCSEGTPRGGFCDHDFASS